MKLNRLYLGLKEVKPEKFSFHSDYSDEDQDVESPDIEEIESEPALGDEFAMDQHDDELVVGVLSIAGSPTPHKPRHARFMNSN
jgi:hypothetical protein